MSYSDLALLLCEKKPYIPTKQAVGSCIPQFTLPWSGSDTLPPNAPSGLTPLLFSWFFITHETSLYKTLAGLYARFSFFLDFSGFCDCLINSRFPNAPQAFSFYDLTDLSVSKTNTRHIRHGIGGGACLSRCFKGEH